MPFPSLPGLGEVGRFVAHKFVQGSGRPRIYGLKLMLRETTGGEFRVHRASIRLL